MGYQMLNGIPYGKNIPNNIALIKEDSITPEEPVHLGNINGEIMLPITSTEAIYDSNGNSLDDILSNIKIYVGEDDKLHFVDFTGADSVLPFNKGEGGGTTIIGPILPVFYKESSNDNAFTITAKSSYGTEFPWKVADGDDNSLWGSNGNERNEWIQFRLDKKRKISHFLIKHRESSCMAKNFEILGSNNEEDWENLGEYTNDKENSYQIANIEIPKEYLYYRINISVNGGSGNGFRVVQLFGENDNLEYYYSGTFTTGTDGGDIVEVPLGFEPDFIIATLPFSTENTYMIYDKQLLNNTKKSYWDLNPAENNCYAIELDPTKGYETGIVEVKDGRFKVRCNAPNTRNVKCNFYALKYYNSKPGDGSISINNNNPFPIIVNEMHQNNNGTFTADYSGYFIALITSNNSGSGEITDFIDIDTTGEIIEGNGTKTDQNLTWKAYTLCKIIKCVEGDTITFSQNNNDRFEFCVYYVGRPVTINNLELKKDSTATIEETNGEYVIISQGNSGYNFNANNYTYLPNVNVHFSGVTILRIPKEATSIITFEGGVSYGASSLVTLKFIDI